MSSQIPTNQSSRFVSLRRLSAVGSLVLLAAVVAAGLWLRVPIALAQPSASHSFSFTANVPGPSAAQTSVPVEIYVPRGASTMSSLTVLVALHGVGGNGPAFARPVYQAADRYGWIVVAPTFVYDSWLDVDQLIDDDVKALAALRSIIQRIPGETSLSIEPGVLLYGFSRGAQLAHRYALFYPIEVRGVASLAAGAYTLPAIARHDAPSVPLNYPLGIANLAAYSGQDFQPELIRNVRFFVGVGTRDTQERDVPREWDVCSGTTRVSRATAFAEALDALSAPVRLASFPNVVHQETPDMRREALDYLAGTSQTADN